MTLVVEKYRQRLLELQLDVEKVQAYILMCKVQPPVPTVFVREPAPGEVVTQPAPLGRTT